MDNITVSVFILTYNQEQFIEHTLESILSQKTKFNFQLVIGEDCSTDKTRQICEEYQLKYPSKIKLLPLLSKNIGLIANYLRTIKACNGKYIAICDGDDYWIDDNKLQMQVSYLEANLDCNIIGTNFKRLYNNGQIDIVKKERFISNYSFEDLIFENLVTSVTVMFRNIQKDDPLPNWIGKFPYGDWPTYLWTIKNSGNIHFLNNVTAVYRTDIGISAKIRKKHSETAKVNLEIVESMASDPKFAHKQEVINKSIMEHKKSLMSCYNRENEYFKALNVLLKSIFSSTKVFHLITFYMYSLKQSIK